MLEEQDSFLALVSHQFKTPLASLQLSLETLALRAPPPQQAQVLIERMLADLARMELMVTQILESARLERGRVDFKSEPLQLAGAVGRVLAQLEERARQAQVDTQRQHRTRSCRCMSDPLALDVVVRNVLENALRGAGAGRRRQHRHQRAPPGARSGARGARHRRRLCARPMARACSRSSRACSPAAPPPTTAPGSACSSCGA